MADYRFELGIDGNAIQDSDTFERYMPFGFIKTGSLPIVASLMAVPIPYTATIDVFIFDITSSPSPSLTGILLTSISKRADANLPTTSNSESLTVSALGPTGSVYFGGTPNCWSSATTVADLTAEVDSPTRFLLSFKVQVYVQFQGDPDVTQMMFVVDPEMVVGPDCLPPCQALRVPSPQSAVEAGASRTSSR